MEGVAALCREFDTLVVTDEIYDHITYDNHSHIPMATIEGMFERTITVGGLGKTFALTGWRLGYACAPEPLSTAVRTVHDFTTICAPTPLQWAAVTALALPQSYYDQLKRDYTARRSRMMGILEAAHFHASAPEGAYYVMADYRDWLSRLHATPGAERIDFEFAEYLTEKVRVAVVPGSNFYRTPGLGRHQVRFAFAKKLETLAAAEERLLEAWV
jgi:aminotransferase